MNKDFLIIDIQNFYMNKFKRYDLGGPVMNKNELEKDQSQKNLWMAIH